MAERERKRKSEKKKTKNIESGINWSCMQWNVTLITRIDCRHSQQVVCFTKKKWFCALIICAAIFRTECYGRGAIEMLNEYDFSWKISKQIVAFSHSIYFFSSDFFFIFPFISTGLVLLSQYSSLLCSLLLFATCVKSSIIAHEDDCAWAFRISYFWLPFNRIGFFSFGFCCVRYRWLNEANIKWQWNRMHHTLITYLIKFKMLRKTHPFSSHFRVHSRD